MFISRSHYGLTDTAAAHEKGLIRSGDMNCAASMPNAIHSYPTNFSTPSVIRSNATALAEAGLSPLFDLIGFTIKPMGAAASEATIVSLDLWRVEDKDDKDVTFVDWMFAFWFD